MKRFAILLLLPVSCSWYSPPTDDLWQMPDESAAETARFRALSEAFIGWTLSRNPATATALGIHDYDHTLGDWSAAAIAERIDHLRDYEARFGAIRPELLPDGDYYDLRIAWNRVRARLLALEEIRSWERDPNTYRWIIAGGLYTPAARSFDTPARRMSAVASRLRDVPRVLADARLNLRRPPALHTRTAIGQFGGTRRFVKEALPAAFAAVENPRIRADFEDAHASALSAIESFIDWMRKELAPRSDGSFAIGEEAYRKKLLYEEMVDAPIDRLLRDGYALLDETRAAMKELAGERTVPEALREAARDAPAPDRLLEETRAMLGDLRAWASSQVDIPDDAECLVQETPEFRRAMSFASMDTPGAFETVAREAYYSITLPEPGWSDEKTAQHMAFFNRANLKLISVHEAYPGHYTQFLRVRDCPSRVRRVFGSGSFSEGWAHYCEQLYAETGDSSAAVRLQMLSMALLRICRYICGIELHTRAMTYEEAVEFFVSKGWLERANAEREALRGTADPTTLVYTLGKIEILKLRDEYLARTGRSLREFHNEFIRHGYPPIPIMRMILLGRE